MLGGGRGDKGKFLMQNLLNFGIHHLVQDSRLVQSHERQQHSIGFAKMLNVSPVRFFRFIQYAAFWNTFHLVVQGTFRGFATSYDLYSLTISQKIQSCEEYGLK